MFQSDSNGRTKEADAADGAAGGDDPDVCLQCLLLTWKVEQSSGTTLFIIRHLAQQGSERILSLAWRTARRTCGGNERLFGGSDRNIGGCYNGFSRRVGREKSGGADAVFLFAQTLPSTGGAVCSSVQREGGTESPSSSFVGGRNCHRWSVGNGHYACREMATTYKLHLEIKWDFQCPTSLQITQALLLLTLLGEWLWEKSKTC